MGKESKFWVRNQVVTQNFEILQFHCQSSPGQWFCAGIQDFEQKKPFPYTNNSVRAVGKKSKLWVGNQNFGTKSKFWVPSQVLVSISKRKLGEFQVFW